MWKWRDLFPEAVSAGAPPDAVFTAGQDWGFAPLHPIGIRENRHEYVISYLSRAMKNAGILRLDHVMGLHRIYWIPRDLQANQGVFVQYPSEDLYAILSLESHRNRCMLVGENLGTVPGYVNEAMSRHNVQKMYVMQYELDGQDAAVLKRPPSNSVASLNTHDMPPFGGYLSGQDIRDRRQAGMLQDEDEANEERNRSIILKNLKHFLREKDLLKASESDTSILQAALAYLSASPARVVLLTLEDLWLEQQAQNLPGTSTERPNWRKKLRCSLEQLQNSPEITDILEMVNRLRKGRTGKIDKSVRTANLRQSGTRGEARNGS
jgi:4-alpha-glucanotransferase